MKELTLRQIEYFVAVAETQSITAAAERCHVSQSAMSLAITDLERFLGITLTIRRRAKGVALTSEGRAVLADARALLEQAGKLVEQVRDSRETLSGTLNIGCFRTLSMHIIPHVLEWFGKNYPQIDLRVHEGNGTEIQERMLAGQLDACVIYEAQLLEGCLERIIQDQRRFALLPSDHPLAAQQEVSLSELARFPAVLLDEAPALETTLEEFRRRSLRPQVLLRTRSVQTAQNIIGRGLAYGILMHQPSHSPEGNPLTGRPISDVLPRNALMLSLPPGQPTAKEEALEASLATLPGSSTQSR